MSFAEQPVHAESATRQPSSPATRRGASHPAPSAGKSATLTAQKTAPLRPLRAPFASPVLLGDSLVGRPGTRPQPTPGSSGRSLVPPSCRPSLLLPAVLPLCFRNPHVLGEARRAFCHVPGRTYSENGPVLGRSMLPVLESTRFSIRTPISTLLSYACY